MSSNDTGLIVVGSGFSQPMKKVATINSLRWKKNFTASICRIRARISIGLGGSFFERQHEHTRAD
jgi:hypothetical protein